jgi:hypothetical protein
MLVILVKTDQSKGYSDFRGPFFLGDESFCKDGLTQITSLGTWAMASQEFAIFWWSLLGIMMLVLRIFQSMGASKRKIRDYISNIII